VSSHESSGLVRVTLRCPQSRDVKWTVRFDGASSWKHSRTKILARP
jgi:hypothetical protein